MKGCDETVLICDQYLMLNYEVTSQVEVRTLLNWTLEQDGLCNLVSSHLL